MTEHTHEVVRKAHNRSSSHNDDDDVEAGMNGMTTFEVGDEITPTEAELEAFPDRFRELRTIEPSGSDEPILAVSEMTVEEVSEVLSTGEYDDDLDTVEELEEQYEGRTGVYEAIDERRE